jgi:phosphatidylethanolamine/phosphatidyl-N-methylethanolamine N-methyltransferase
MHDLTVVRELPRSDELILSRDEPRYTQGLQPVLKEHWRFFAAFLRRPATVGALMPSSALLAQALLEQCNLRSARTVVELGPGTGAVTRFILDRIGRQTTFLALELDSKATQGLRSRFPGLTVYSDSAEHLQHYLGRHGRKKADCIVSGLPWASMTTDIQDRILDAVLRVLKAGGVFTTFAYLHAIWMPKARRFRERLEQRFGTVEVSRTVWRNVPPAYVYRCR